MAHIGAQYVAAPTQYSQIAIFVCGELAAANMVNVAYIQCLGLAAVLA